jgi:hypothetical protein
MNAMCLLASHELPCSMSHDVLLDVDNALHVRSRSGRAHPKSGHLLRALDDAVMSGIIIIDKMKRRNDVPPSAASERGLGAGPEARAGK